jgi:hypothetical protein
VLEIFVTTQVELQDWLYVTEAEVITAFRPSVTMSEYRSTRLDRLRPRKPQVAKQNDPRVPCNESSRGSGSSAQFPRIIASATPPTTYSPCLPSSDSEYKPSKRRAKKAKKKAGKHRPTQRPTNKHKAVRLKTPQHWDSTWDAQWYKPTDTAWSGHSQSSGDIVYPRRFEDPDWNVLNEWWWIKEEGPHSALGMGGWNSLICAEASTERVSLFVETSRGEAKLDIAGPSNKYRQPLCTLCGNAHTAIQCPICDRCLAYGHTWEGCGAFDDEQQPE